MQQVWRSTSIIFVSFSLSAQVGATHVLSHLKAGTNVGRLPAADDVATSTTDPCWWVGDYQPNSVVEHVGRWKFKNDEIWWNMEHRSEKKTSPRLWFKIFFTVFYHYFFEMIQFDEHICQMVGETTKSYKNGWFNPLRKGLLLRGTPIRILNHTAPNHPFTRIVDNHQQHPINSCFWFP